MPSDPESPSNADEIDDLVDAILGALEPLLVGNGPSPSPADSRVLYDLWTQLECVLYRANCPDISEVEAGADARAYLKCGGLDNGQVDTFIATCQKTGSSWRATREVAVVYANMC